MFMESAEEFLGIKSLIPDQVAASHYLYYLPYRAVVHYIDPSIVPVLNIRDFTYKFTIM